jgi:hypothetical protein
MLVSAQIAVLSFKSMAYSAPVNGAHDPEVTAQLSGSVPTIMWRAKGSKMLRNWFVCALLMCATISVSAAGWVTIGKSESATISLDVTSIVHAGPIVRVWERIAYPTPAVQPGYNVPLSSKLVHVSINCRDNTIAAGAISAYGASGAVVDMDRGKPNDFDDIAPESVAEAIRDAVCPK